jgi:hypothetical protein
MENIYEVKILPNPQYCRFCNKRTTHTMLITPPNPEIGLKELKWTYYCRDCTGVNKESK